MIVKSQSAMEYLMTYGWAILIVAVVLGALYSLGIFNGANFLGGTCIAAPGYLCTNPLLSTSGKLSFTYGYQGSNVTMVGFACTNTTAAPSSFAASGASDLEPGQEESVSVTCPLSSSATIGTQYSGYLWVEYDQAGQSNLIARIATVGLPVSVNGVTQYYDVYVVNRGAESVSVIDSRTDTVVNTIAIGSGGREIDWDAAYPAGSQVYVASFGEDNVYPIYVSNNVVGTPIPVSGSPTGIAMSSDGTELAVGLCNSPGGFVEISTATDSVTHNEPSTANAIDFIAANPRGRYFYGATGGCGGTNTLTLDTVTHALGGDIGPVIPSDEETGIAVTQNGENAYIAEGSWGAVDVNIAADSWSTVGGVAAEFPAVTPSGNYVWFPYSTSMYVVSTSDDTLSHTIALPSGSNAYFVAFTPDGKEAFVADDSVNEVLMIYTSNYVIGATIPVGTDPEGIAIVEKTST
jgi:YVTN family beta-propeller protein